MPSVLCVCFWATQSSSATMRDGERSERESNLCRRMTASNRFRSMGVLVALIFAVVKLGGGVNGMAICPPCGNTSVPYPLSTSSSCGHPLYPISCTPLHTLELRALSGNYTIKSIDAVTRTFIIVTPTGFIGNSCIAQESSIKSPFFALNSSMPFFLTPNNTVFLLNSSKLMLFAPIDCSPSSPCFRALPVFPQVSCRSLLCCAFSITFSPGFKYQFSIYGPDQMGYTGVVNLDNRTQPNSWIYGLQVGWESPQEPPCTTQPQCSDNSYCSSSMTRLGTFCLCKQGYEWVPTTGTCSKVPYCKLRSQSINCHKSVYAIGISLASVAMIALLSLTFYLCMKHWAVRKAQEKLVKERAAILAGSGVGRTARLFSRQEMERATNNFACDMLLGCGGYGEVYKGILKDGTVVAIKSAKIGNAKGTDQVLNEVRVLSQVNHRNLVALLGCCVESELPLLVYEYAPNGNLYDHINGLKGNFMDWETRLRIGFQAAEALVYLHSAAHPPIYHRDVKPSNILLDKSMNAKVSDFGISRLADADLTHVSTCAQGTLGYLDPEYYYSCQYTDKSDVYSFGVVLLELVTSKKAIDFERSCEEEVNLVVMVQRRVQQGQLDEVLDSKLTHGASEAALDSMGAVIALALHCLNVNRFDRPSMKEVADELRHTLSTLY